MRKLNFLILFLIIGCAGSKSTKPGQPVAPEFAKGTFTDDYGIRYTINDTLWIQEPRTVYHIIKWNLKEQYIIARNGNKNPSDQGLYTRIDFMKFKDMAPFVWGFCLTEYKAENDLKAEATASADRKNPKSGCNGYPFSRMKRTE